MNISDIIDYVGVNEMQVEMAIYSGRLPKPNSESEWNFNDIKQSLDYWKERIDEKNARLRKDKSIGNNYSSGNMVIPKHTR